MPQQTPVNFIEKIKVAAQADPRKALILGVLVAVMLGMWGKLVFTGKMSPKAASAAFVATPTPQQRIAKAKFLDKLTATNNPLQEWLRGSISPLQRNLFAVNLDFFPQDQTKIATKATRTPTGDGFWDQLAKSMGSQADHKKERQVLVENLHLQARQLRLQSTMMGSVPQAMMNDQILKEGDSIESFRIVRIEARRIVVEREGVKLEIVMK